ncbi:MAG: hypothetical protein HY361_00200 [Candidatus Aenigmarchaeota archaeon]|nr:hypothetical protein [Candidatus Aenigmarchaeota archaeon]
MQNTGLDLPLIEDRTLKLAREAAQHEVKGFVLHDEKDYIKGAIHFGLAYKIINSHRINPVSDEDALLAGVHKMGVLRAYDIIVDDPEITLSYIDPTIQTNPGFKSMLYHALEECRLFGLPENYGRNKVEWYMQHAEWVKLLPNKFSQNLVFLDKLKEAEKTFVHTISGESQLFERAWPLYLVCVLLHDIPRINGLLKHDEANISDMIEAYTTYLSILFRHKLNNK